ncbi:hypothetical protein [Dyadobacter bucti]|jgi:hypothetical protein|uniref:hypothetical protein n=1 Tax=Dyadobacter bucti TaxID=2572203 RepID=UPI0011090676|nr:hypothetical protein [Dyadobacter bucti]
MKHTREEYSKEDEANIVTLLNDEIEEIFAAFGSAKEMQEILWWMLYYTLSNPNNENDRDDDDKNLFFYYRICHLINAIENYRNKLTTPA